MRDVVPLLERLALGVPPDEVDGTLPDWRLPLTAGWFYRIGRSPIPYTRERTWYAEDDEILCRLVLKAIESIHLTRLYRRSQPEKSMLSKEEIVRRLDEGPLKERLIITPLLDRNMQISGTSIDLRLGFDFILPRRANIQAIDSMSPSSELLSKRFNERVTLV
jgi:hypothetical protein